MKTVILILALTATTQAAFQLGSDGPGGVSTWHGDHWDHDGIHADQPQPVPEPSSPIVMMIASAVALVSRRHRGRGRWIWEKRIDLQTVRFP
jgi:hypothetical protein